MHLMLPNRYKTKLKRKMSISLGFPILALRSPSTWGLISDLDSTLRNRRWASLSMTQLKIQSKKVMAQLLEGSQMEQSGGSLLGSTSITKRQTYPPRKAPLTSPKRMISSKTGSTYLMIWSTRLRKIYFSNMFTKIQKYRIMSKSSMKV